MRSAFCARKLSDIEPRGWKPRHDDWKQSREIVEPRVKIYIRMDTYLSTLCRFSSHCLNVRTIAAGGQSSSDATMESTLAFSVDRSSAACAQRRLRSFTEDSLQSLTYLAPGPRWAPPLYTSLARPFAAPSPPLRPFDSVCTVAGVLREDEGEGEVKANRRKRKVAGASLKGRNALLSVPSTPQNFINCAFCYADSCRASLSLPTPGSARSNLVCRPARPH